MNNCLEYNNIKHLTGLIGSPVSQSLSQKIHRQLFIENKMEGYDYILIDSCEKGLEQTIKSLDERFVGFNVTMPDKKTIINFLDDVSDEAKEIGAVNTVKIYDGKMIGYNTDGKGFLNALRKYKVEFKEKNVLIYGTGGAAKAINFVLKSNGANITMLHRPTKEELRDKLKIADIFINASPVGMDGISTPIDSFLGVKNSLFVADLIYNPSKTKLLNLALDAGLEFMNGYDMLLEQAKLSFEIFHNK